MFTAQVVLLFLLTAGVAFADSSYYSGYSQSVEGCNLVTAKGSADLVCQGKTSGVPTGGYTLNLNEILYNNGTGFMTYLPNGGAFGSCTNATLCGTVVGAACGGVSVAMIDLDQICAIESGGFKCGPKDPTTSAKTTPPAVVSSPSAPVTTSISSAPSATNPAQSSSPTSCPRRRM